MRKLAIALLALGGSAALAACTASAVPDTPSPRAQRDLAEALAGRTQGPAVRCIPNYRANNMRVIDDSTILFQDGRTVYLQKPRGECFGIGNGSRTLVTRPFGTTDLCDGDINRTIDLVSHIEGGSCVFGPFVPYTKAKS